MNRLRLLIVTSTERIDDRVLTTRERAQVAALPGAHRRHDWLVSRRALRMALALTGACSDATEFRFPHRRASLTHTGSMAAAALAMAPLPDRVVGIGVDAESPRAIDARTARFFLRRDEHRHRDGPENHLRLWTVKEALFKADPDNDGAMLTDYRIATPEAWTGLARRPTRPGMRFCYRTTRADDGGYLTVAAALAGPRSPTPRSWSPMSNITFDDVTARIYELLPTPAGSLTPETKIRDLAADSLTLVEMVIDMQDEFDVIFSQSQLAHVVTLADLVSLLQTEDKARVETN